MSRHLHRDAFGNSSTYEIPHGCSSKVMRNAAGTARLLASLSPRPRESNDPLAFDFLAAAVEDPRTENAFGFEPVVFGLLSLQQVF